MMLRRPQFPVAQLSLFLPNRPLLIHNTNALAFLGLSQNLPSREPITATPRDGF